MDDVEVGGVLVISLKEPSDDADEDKEVDDADGAGDSRSKLGTLLITSLIKFGVAATSLLPLLMLLMLELLSLSLLRTLDDDLRLLMVESVC